MSRRLLASALALALSSLALAQPLTTAFTFQGDLKTAGTAATGAYDARFRLYDALTGGTQLGPTLCSDNVAVANGLLTTQLDFGPQFSGQQRYLEIDIRQDTGLNCSSGTGFTTLSPRQPLTAAPNSIYSLNATAATTAATATNSTQLNGQPAAFYQNAANLIGTLSDARLAGTYSGPLSLSNSTNIIAGSGAGLTSLNASSLASGTLAAARLPVPLALSGASPTNIFRADNAATSPGAAAIIGAATGGAGNTYGVFGTNSSASGRAVFGWSTAAAGFNYGLYGENDSTNGIGVYGTATATLGPTIGGRFESSSTSGTGVYGYASATTGGANGGWFESSGTSGTGIYGYASATSGDTNGGRFVSASTSGNGIFGYASATSGSTVGVLGNCNSPQGVAVKGQTSDISGNSIGVLGANGSTAGSAVVGNQFATTGVTFGVVGFNYSSSGVAVQGTASATSGVTTGVYGQNSSPSGYAGRFEGPGADCVYINNTGSGRGLRITSPSDTALWAISSGFAAVDARNDATSGTAYGLIGRTSSPTGFGVFSSGNMGASGVKPFRIDHPDDPAHKYLFHYSTESPEALNSYRGTVALNEQGEATIDLPAYFAKINKDPSYQLTAVGAPMPLLHVSQEISGDALAQGEKAAPSEHAPLCSFTISGGAPNAKVCWRIEALRNDRWVQAHGAPVEVNKEGPEDGTYQHPDLYAQPGEKGVLDGRRSTKTP